VVKGEKNKGKGNSRKYMMGPNFGTMLSEITDKKEMKGTDSVQFPKRRGLILK